MKKYILHYALTALLLLPAHLGAENRIRIAVMNFRPQSVAAHTASVLSDIIRTEMSNSSDYLVIERAHMDMILKESAFQKTGCTDEACAVEIGKLLSASKLLIGSVTRVGAKVIINGRLVDIEKGISEFGETVSIDSEENIVEGARTFASNLHIRMNGTSKTTVALPAYDKKIIDAAANRTAYAVKPLSISSSFIDKGNGTITDTSTGLIWQRQPFSSRLNWERAAAYTRNLRLGGYDDWRIPTRDELISVIRNSGELTSSMLRKNGFVDIASDTYWTSTAVENDASCVWGIDLGSDLADACKRTGRYRVWSVRGRMK